MALSNVIKAKLTEREITQAQLAKTLKHSIQTVNRKINGKCDFTETEIRKLKELLNLEWDDVQRIFFS